MDHVLAKIKRRKKPLKLLSDQTLFDMNLVGLDFVEYNPDHNLDEDAWFRINQFSQQNYSATVDWITQDFVSADYDNLPKSKFSDISYLCAIQGNNFHFQKVTPSQFVTRKMIAFGEVAELEQNDGRLVVNAMPDASYLKDSDVLIFRNLATISSIFKGIDVIYKEATDEEVGNFLDESFIELSNGYDVAHVSKPNRKRIALAMNTLASMSPDDKAEMLSYIDGYSKEKLKFHEGNGKFAIATDNELKHLIYGIEQRFYTTPFSQEKRLANSVLPI